MARPRKVWSHTVEEMGIAVRVYERTPGSALSREVRTPDAIRRALGEAGMDLGHADHWPHGAVRWSASHDKKG